MIFDISKINKGAILIIIAVLLLGLMMGKFIALSPVVTLVITASIFIALLTIVKTDIALIILIFSMLLSPELKLAEMSDRLVVMRIDDILLFVVFISWLAKMAINRSLGMLRHTPLNPLIIVYILVCVLSTAIGISTGHVRPLKSFFYILKYVEYFMLYFLVTNNIRDKKQIKIFMTAFLITCTLTCAYAITTVGGTGRATAPFEGAHREPNTLGGYLILLFAIVAGFFLYAPSRKWRFCCGILSCFIFLTLLQTLSRGSYLGFAAIYLTLVILTKKKKVFLIVIMLIAIIILPSILPVKVTDRISKTFVPGVEYKPFGEKITLDYSAAARVEVWKDVLEKWKSRPILGYGITGAGLVDTQYARLLGETGIIGFGIFTWLMIAIFKNGLWVFKTIQDDWGRGLTLGFLAGFIGLLVHSFSAATFIIVRIMEPFWFLAAVVMMLPEIYRVNSVRKPFSNG